MTRCLPPSMAASACRTPAMGWPVASMTHSISSHPASAPASSRTQVLPVLTASPRLAAPGGPVGPPTRASAARAVPTSRVAPPPTRGARVVQDAGLAGLDSVAEARGAVAVGGPARAGEGGAGLADIEVGDPHDVEPRDALGLRQHHRAELAGADQADPDRAAARRPLLEHGGKVHAVPPWRCELRAGAGAPGRIGS